jgi:plastocyanin
MALLTPASPQPEELPVKSILYAGLLAGGIYTLAWAAETSVTQAGQAFSETDVTIKAGDHIKFLNQDDVKHNILVQAGDDDDDAKDWGLQAPGQTLDVPFDKAGKFLVRCHIHPGMKLAVTVN